MSVKQLLTMCILLVGSLLITNSIFGADLKPTLSVNDNSITVNDQIQLTITLENADNFPTIPLDLDGFSVLSGPSQSSSFQMINGKTSSSKKLIYLIAPNKSGNLTIGPLEFKYQGKTYQTNKVTVRVSQSSASTQNQNYTGNKTKPRTGNDSSNDPIFIKAEVDRSSVYTGEQVTVTYRLYTRLNARSYSLEKQPNAVGFWSEEIPTPKQPTGTERVINGLRYNTFIIKRTAYFPTESGKLTLDPLTLTVEVQAQSRRRSPFDDFFSGDPFFGQTVTKRVVSNPVEIEAKPIPQKDRPASFIGAVGQFTLDSSLDTTVVHVDEAVGVTVNLKGTGNISTIGTPEVKTQPHLDMFDPEVKKTSDIKSGELSGSIKYQYVFIPREAGTVQLPDLAFSYFDPSDKKFHTLKTGSYAVKVQPLDQPAVASGSGYSKEEVKLLNSDIRYLKPKLSSLKSVDAAYYKQWTFYAVLLLSIAVIGGSIGYRYWWKRWGQDTVYLRRKNAMKRAKQKLSEANVKTEDKEYYSLLNSAVLGFIGDRCNIAENAFKTDELTQILEKQSVPDDTIEEVKSFLATCDAGRFAPNAQQDGYSEQLRTEAQQLVNDLDKYL